jgi:uncharacterized membrane protein/ribosomal protein L40E
MTRFCTQCGATVDETARFCKRCGKQLLPTQPAEQTAGPRVSYQNPPNYEQQAGYRESTFREPEGAPYQAPALNADLKPNIAGMLCYPLSFITGILFLLLKPYNKDQFVRFHAFQSILFFVVLLGLNIATRVLFLFSWPLSNLLSTGLKFLAFGGTIWLMYQAYQGIKFKLPVIGDIAENQADKQ